MLSMMTESAAPFSPALLKKVDNLKITFIVDNTIEWFLKLPPGFSNELRYHLSNQTMPFDERTGVPILDFESFCCGAHGFSALIETKLDGEPSHKILFDTGPESKSIIRNIKGMKVPVHDVERVILSHWHSDHSGGLLAFLQHHQAEWGAHHPKSNESSPIIVDLHPNRPIARGIAPPAVGKVIGRLAEDPSFEDINKYGKVELNNHPHVVADGTVFVSGEIPRKTSFEEGLVGGMRWIEENDEKKWISEPHVMDERYAAIDVLGKGLVIFSACSHAGIVNVLLDAVETFKRPIYMVIGGLHLGGPELEYRVKPTVDFLSQHMRPAPTYVLPMHCSGFPVKLELERALGEGCVPAGVGNHINVDGDAEADKRLFPPVISSAVPLKG